MKKRVKLLTTIASLCLAVALMAFGVYAASTASLDVTSKVTFAATDVYVTINGTQYKGATGSAAATQVVAMEEFKSYTGTTEKTPEATADKDWEITDLALDTTNRGVKYVITITNDGTDTITVTATGGVKGDATNFTAGTATEKVGEEDYSAATGLATGETYTYTIYADITDITTAASIEFEISFAIARK